jgi:hypothetical protein
MTETVAPEAPAAGPLSMEAAMGILAQRRAEQAAPAAPEEAAPEPEPELEPESDAEPTAEEVPDPDDEPAIEDEGEEEPDSDPEAPAIAAPKSWDAKERAEFAKLPRTAQEIILARETERDQAISRALNEASSAKTKAETEAQAKVTAEVAKLGELHTTLSQVVTQAQQAFAGKWDNVDWVAFARQDPQAYTIAKAEYEADVAAIQQTKAAEDVALRAKQEAQRAEFQNRQQAEAVRLSEIAPELVDPKDGPARRQKVAEFLVGLGIPQGALEGISALEAALAYDAMRFREGKAKLAPQAKPKAPPAPAPKVAAPSAAPPPRPTRQRAVEAAKSRLRESGRMDDALAVLRARRGS